MSKGILEFKLPEEREEFELAQKGVQLSAQIENFYLWIRNKHKYGERETVTIEELQDAYNEIFVD